LNLQEEYFGFSSKVGKIAFFGPEHWKADLVEFHHESEHTINEKRFGLEMQIYHVIDPVKNAKSTAASTTITSSAHRRLSAHESLELKYAAISIMFDVNLYSPDIP
jgi:hypothetical protein